MDQQSSKDSVASEESRTNVSDSALYRNSSNGDAAITSNVPTNTDNSNVPTGNARTPEGVANMSFTVDFGDEAKPHVEGKSIGDFMPSRLRKSFRERKGKSSEKSFSTPTKSSSKDKITPEKATESCVSRDCIIMLDI